nr:hypothetical protein [Anaerovibrio sp.]
LGDMAAQDSEEYVDIATALGNNPELLLDLRTHLRDIIKASPLMDEAGYTAKVEQAYRRALADKPWLVQGYNNR